MQGVDVGSRIRERREKAGLTQAQLAEAVFATRQTVGNWERGATLPDIQSLQLLASVFRVTVDELLGTSAAELAREAANDRRMLMRSFAMEWVYIAVIAATGFARFALERSGASFSAYQGWSLLLIAVQGAVMLCMLGAVAGRDRVMHAWNLVRAIDVVAFLEGRTSVDELPRDWFYRWVLTKMDRWRLAFAVIASLALVGMVLNGA